MPAPDAGTASLRSATAKRASVFRSSMVRSFLASARPVTPRDRLMKRLPMKGTRCAGTRRRSEEHTSELQSLMRLSYAVFCLKNIISFYLLLYNIIYMILQHMHL